MRYKVDQTRQLLDIQFLYDIETVRN